MYYLYLIRNKQTGKISLGYTNDLRRRMEAHREKNPELISYGAYKSEQDAREREQKLKQRGYGIRHLKNRLRRSLEQI